MVADSIILAHKAIFTSSCDNKVNTFQRKKKKTFTAEINEVHLLFSLFDVMPLYE